MIVSAIGAGSPNFYPQITAESFKRVPAVQPYQPEKKAAEFLPSEDLLGSLAAQQNVNPLADNSTAPTAESPLPGTAYGMSAQDLRQTSMRLQLLGEVNPADNSLTPPTEPMQTVMGAFGDSARQDSVRAQAVPAAQATPVTTDSGSDAMPVATVTPEVPAAPTASSSTGAKTEGQGAGKETAADVGQVQTPDDEAEAAGEEQAEDDQGAETDAAGQQLSKEEKQDVQKLQQRDAEVRTHEQAHMAAAGAYANGGPSYSYQNGPDGKRYAIGGSVSIDTSPEDTPEATIRKMQTVRSAALAPAEPSGQDRSVAAQAAAAQAQAAAEMMQERTEKAKGGGDESAEKSGTAIESGAEGAESAPATPQGVNATAGAEGQNPENSGQNSGAATSGGLANMSDLIEKQRQAQGANGASASGKTPASTASQAATTTANDAPRASGAAISRLSFSQMNALRAYGIAG